jgi:hypothetical protein
MTIHKPVEKEMLDKAKMRLHMGVVLIMASGMWKGRKQEGVSRAPLIKRQRVKMENIFYELGPRNSRRAYRMSIKSFWKLCDLLKKGYILTSMQGMQRLRRMVPLT